MVANSGVVKSTSADQNPFCFIMVGLCCPLCVIILAVFSSIVIVAKFAAISPTSFVVIIVFIFLILLNLYKDAVCISDMYFYFYDGDSDNQTQVDQNQVTQQQQRSPSPQRTVVYPSAPPMEMMVVVINDEDGTNSPDDRQASVDSLPPYEVACFMETPPTLPPPYEAVTKSEPE